MTHTLFRFSALALVVGALLSVAPAANASAYGGTIRYDSSGTAYWSGSSDSSRSRDDWRHYDDGPYDHYSSGYDRSSTYYRPTRYCTEGGGYGGYIRYTRDGTAQWQGTSGTRSSYCP